MKNNFFKGAAVLVGIMIIDMIINIICNINGIELNSMANTFVTVFCAVTIYDRWTRNEKNEE